jgi:hypothetical protein
MRLEAQAFEGRFAKLKSRRLFAPAFGGHFPESFLDQSFQGRFLPLGDFSRFVEKTIGYMYGRFHTANHIISPLGRQAAASRGSIQ